MTAQVLMATHCTKSLGCESGGHKHGGDGGRRLCCVESSAAVRKMTSVWLRMPIVKNLKESGRMSKLHQYATRRAQEQK